MSTKGYHECCSLTSHPVALDRLAILTSGVLPTSPASPSTTHEDGTGALSSDRCRACDRVPPVDANSPSDAAQKQCRHSVLQSSFSEELLR